jgi:hypothetical protein
VTDALILVVPRHKVPDPHVLAGLIGDGYDVVGIAEARGGHELILERRRPARGNAAKRTINPACTNGLSEQR